MLKYVALLQGCRQNLFYKSRHFSALMSVPVTNAKQMSDPTFPEVRVQDKTVLVLLARVAWHKADPGSERIFRNHIVKQVTRTGI